VSIAVVVLLLIAALLLVALGGLLAAADQALATLSSAELNEIAETSRARASLRRIAADRGSHVIATNFVRIVAETLAAVIVTTVLAYLLEWWWLALIVATVIMAGVSFVLVGSSPRTVGRTHPRQIMVFSAPLLSGLRRILGPVARALVALGDRVTPGAPRGPVSNEEQLLSIVDQAVELEVIEEGDRAFIHSIFELSETVAREVMVPRTDMITIGSDATLSAAARLFFDTGVSRVPVEGENADDILGVLYLRDAARALVDDPQGGARPVTALMRPAVFVPESLAVDVLLRQMQRDAVHLVLVVDEHGGIAGLVTLEDVLEEVVGDISDEHDHPDALAEPLGDGSFRVNVRLPIGELGELFGLELEDDEVDTVGGLLAKAVGRLPVVGDEATVDGVRLTAERVEGRPKRLVTVLARADDELGQIFRRPADSSSEQERR